MKEMKVRDLLINLRDNKSEQKWGKKLNMDWDSSPKNNKKDNLKSISPIEVNQEENNQKEKNQKNTLLVLIRHLQAQAIPTNIPVIVIKENRQESLDPTNLRDNQEYMIIEVWEVVKQKMGLSKTRVVVKIFILQVVMLQKQEHMGHKKQKKLLINTESRGLPNNTNQLNLLPKLLKSKLELFTKPVLSSPNTNLRFYIIKLIFSMNNTL